MGEDIESIRLLVAEHVEASNDSFSLFLGSEAALIYALMDSQCVVAMGNASTIQKNNKVSSIPTITENNPTNKLNAHTDLIVSSIITRAATKKSSLQWQYQS